jgi:hypothetical protein
MFQNEHGQANYLPWHEMVDICERLGLKTVPELFLGPWSVSLVDMADGPSRMPKARHHREGIVIKPIIEKWHSNVGRLILKRISDAYLLSKDRTEFH